MSSISIDDLDAQLAAAEELRLRECTQELIRSPGAIQSHGAVLVIDAESRVVLGASANSTTFLGVSEDLLVGTSISDLPGLEPRDAFGETLDGEANPISVKVGAQSFDVIIRRNGEISTLDFEPTMTVGPGAVSAIFEGILRLSRSSSIEALWTNTAAEVATITGFDRVMVYRFHPDGHGEVVGEERAAGMDPYLGLHYPASDIPSQARELYLSKLSRVIARSDDLGTALTAPIGSEFDLSRSELRAVSPHHLQFMRNMGQASTVSFSLVHDGTLIGMITCAHRTPRRLPYAVRQGLETLATQVALHMNSMESIDQLMAQVRIRTIRNRLLAQVGDSSDFDVVLLRGETTLLDLVPADGVMTFVDGRTGILGATPDPEVMMQVVAHRLSVDNSLYFVSDSLPRDDQPLAELLPEIAGLIMLPLGGEGNFLAWFRMEVSSTVNWLGDQTSANRLTPLSPRNSFASWTQSVAGKSHPWDGLETEAAELARDLDGVLLRRAESTLAKLALHDPLTGLPNRRLLMDRIDHALARYARGEELALLFIDIDRFKSINDTYGHDVGDAVLLHASLQIRSATRVQDTVARLGGDEFVILCENTTAEEADLVSSRVLRALRTPTEIDGETVHITASIGVAAVNLNFSARELLREADTAMYRAKSRGRNRASR